MLLGEESRARAKLFVFNLKIEFLAKTPPSLANLERLRAERKVLFQTTEMQKVARCRKFRIGFALCQR
jgi:hypothetical protein